jgi:acyl-CoA synthetase (AMP-forming)/AMP-acid ligase II
MTSHPPLTIPQLLLESVAAHGDVEALVDGDVSLTHGQLLAHVQRAGQALIAAGVQPGDRIAIWAPNCWEWVVASLATHCVGGVLLPINTRYRGSEAASLLQRSAARVLFTVTDFLDTNYVSLLLDGPDGRPELPDLQQIVVLRGSEHAETTTFGAFVESGGSVGPEQFDVRAAAVTPDDLCHLMFTSGTTGQPKGVMLEHGAVCRGFESWCDVIGLRAGDRYLVVNPYFHSFGLNAGILACLMRGATNLPHAVFDVPAIMQRISDDRITVLPGPPAIYQSMLQHPDLDPSRLGTLRLAVTGAAVIPVQLIVDMREVLGFDTVVTGYGLTESSGIATMCRHDDDPETIATTSGRAIPGVEVQVVDETGAEVERGTNGEIVVRGYNVMRGYADDPDATAEAIDADGWLHTGDIGVMDERGYIQITDRMKDMFIVGGFNAYPAEIEQALGAHPHIAQAAVIGIPDERLGEVGMAFVVPTGGATIDPDEVIAWARERMANYKAPRRVEVIEALPLVPAGKVDKNALRTRAGV